MNSSSLIRDLGKVSQETKGSLGAPTENGVQPIQN